MPPKKSQPEKKEGGPPVVRKMSKLDLWKSYSWILSAIIQYLLNNNKSESNNSYNNKTGGPLQAWTTGIIEEFLRAVMSTGLGWGPRGGTRFTLDDKYKKAYNNPATCSGINP